MKKNILIATPSLNSGGVEVSLIRFITELAKNKNLNIDLLLLKKEGIYLEKVPNNVKILEVNYDNDIYNYNKKIKDIKCIKGLKDKLKFFKYRLKLKNALNNGNWEKYYELILSHMLKIKTKYDLAIDYHGYGHFVTAVIESDKIISKKKITWIHDAKIDWLIKVKKIITSFDKIYCVSKSCLEEVNNMMPNLCKKTDLFYNLIDYKNILSKSGEKLSVSLYKKLKLVTVGRLEWQKGYDIAIEIGKILKDKNIDFCWYIVGGGTEKENILNKIKKFNLENNFKLLGVLKNPFPIIKNADLYIQPSRHEGYGLAIAEAKVLGKVVIATDLDCIKEQIINGENGFLCKLDSTEFAQTIIDVYDNKKLLNEIKDKLKKESFDYTYQFDKLYELMED